MREIDFSEIDETICISEFAVATMSNTRNTM